jgi:hypothetical protein
MTSSEAIELAKQYAGEPGEADGPWSSKTSVAKRCIWPGQHNWRVILRAQSGLLTFTLIVNEKTRQVSPVRRVWDTNEPGPVKLGLVLLFVLKLIVGGAIVWVLLRYGAHAPIWRATLMAIPGALAFAIFYDLLEAKILMTRTENEIRRKKAERTRNAPTSANDEDEDDS